MERKDVKLEEVSPMMREYLKTKSEYEGIILFYRLGDFYEMFFDDAITASHELVQVNNVVLKKEYLCVEYHIMRLIYI